MATSAEPLPAPSRANRAASNWRKSGTIVLDEVAALAPGMQAKLLRVLEERTFERLGGTETLRMEARLMALTNTDLAKAVETGRFREDLFFRLNVLAIYVPPLRERRADIVPLASHFLARLAPVHGRAEASFDPDSLAMLQAYAWPGNVRELKNAVEHALVFGEKPLLSPKDFPEIVRTAGSEHGLTGMLRSLEDLEREAIKANAGSHALQNWTGRGYARHQPQNSAGKTQEVRPDLKLHTSKHATS